MNEVCFVRQLDWNKFTKINILLILFSVICPALTNADSGGGSGGDWSSGASDGKVARQISEALDGEDYATAITLLLQQNEAQPGNPDTLNLLGYSHRQMGKSEPALEFYRQALEIDPKHRGAHAYLGELYLQTGDLAKAEAQLSKLDDLCFFTCRELRELKSAIKAHKAKS